MLPHPPTNIARAGRPTRPLPALQLNWEFGLPLVLFVGGGLLFGLGLGP
jgi:hypothetical protein